MQKCTLSRIKSYEESHYQDSKKLINNKSNSSINSIKGLNDEYFNYFNNNTDSNNFNIFNNFYDKNFNLTKKNRQINKAPTNFISNNYKLNICKSSVQKKNNYVFEKRKKYFHNQKSLSQKQKNSIFQKKNIGKMHNNFQNNRNYFVSTGNTTGEIDISENEDINEFNSDENETILKSHIPSLTNIFCFPKYFGNTKNIKEIEKKGIDSIKNIKIKGNKKTNLAIDNFRKIKEEGNKNYTANNSKNKNRYFNKLNFIQPNQKKISKKNSKVKNIKNNKISHNINKKPIRQISSYNNLNKTNSLLKNIAYRNDFTLTKNYSSNGVLKKYDLEKFNLKKEDTKSIQKSLFSTPAKNIKISKIFQRTDKNKNYNFIHNKNIPNIFIKNNILNTNNIKRPITKNTKINMNDTYSKGKKLLSNSKNIGLENLNMKQIFKPKNKKNMNMNSNEKADISTSYKSKNNSYKKKLINSSNIIKKQNINIELNLKSPYFFIKKSPTQIKNNINNINCTKRIIKRVNKTKILDKPKGKKFINHICSNKDSFIKKGNIILSNNIANKDIIIKNIKKGMKSISESTIINYSNTFISSNSESTYFFKNFENDSESDTDKEDNAIKKNYLSEINKNFDNAKKILNRKIKEKNKNDMIIEKKKNSCKNNKNNIENKKNKNVTNTKNMYKAFLKSNISKYLDKKSFVHLSLLNKMFYKTIRILIFQYFYIKIIKDKESKKNQMNLLRNLFHFSSKDLNLKNKPEIIKIYDYYSKKIKSNYKEDILKDISRTFPKDINFNQKIKTKLYYLLICYSNFNKKIGYAQGLNFVAASCLYFFSNEEDAFLFLDSFINRFKLYNLLGIDNKMLIHKIKYLEFLLNKYMPKLTEYLKMKLLNHEFFSTGWIITVFSNNMDKNQLLICWCFMIVFGWKFFYSFIIQVLIKYQDSIINSEEIKLCSKMKTILNNEQFIKDFKSIIKNTLNFMAKHIVL